MLAATCNEAEAAQCDQLCEKVNVRDFNNTSHEETYCLCRFELDQHDISIRVKRSDENDGMIVNCTSKPIPPNTANFIALHTHCTVTSHFQPSTSATS